MLPVNLNKETKVCEAELAALHLFEVEIRKTRQKRQAALKALYSAQVNSKLNKLCNHCTVTLMTSGSQYTFVTKGMKRPMNLTEWLNLGIRMTKTTIKGWIEQDSRTRGGNISQTKGRQNNSPKNHCLVSRRISLTKTESIVSLLYKHYKLNRHTNIIGV